MSAQDLAFLRAIEADMAAAIIFTIDDLRGAHPGLGMALSNTDVQNAFKPSAGSQAPRFRSIDPKSPLSEKAVRLLGANHVLRAA